MQKQILLYLQNCANNKTLSHAYSFIGARNIGRTELLKSFLIDFVPSQDLNHPDIRSISPEKSIISINKIRESRSWLAQTPISSDKKVLIINSANAMNTEAQNAFLKILEEPAKNTYIFLLINHKDQVLPTIYSRTVPFYFSGKPVIESENQDNSLIQNILKEDSSNQRMRVWLEAGVEKEHIQDWIESLIPVLRAELLKHHSKKLSKAIRILLDSLSRPISQNWQLVAEQSIISI